MTINTTLPPPKTAPFFACSEEGCDNKYQGYHGKVGCKCYSCDDKTPVNIRKPTGPDNKVFKYNL